VAAGPGGRSVFVTGTTVGATKNYATVAYNAATGVPRWVRRYNGPASSADSANSLAVSLGGSAVFVTGTSVLRQHRRVARRPREPPRLAVPAAVSKARARDRAPRAAHHRGVPGSAQERRPRTRRTGLSLPGQDRRRESPAVPAGRRRDATSYSLLSTAVGHAGIPTQPARHASGTGRPFGARRRANLPASPKSAGMVNMPATPGSSSCDKPGTESAGSPGSRCR